MRQFLDQLPHVIITKSQTRPPTAAADAAESRQPEIVARALEATLHLRQATIIYYSKSSERTKSYLVHPYRLAYAQGGLYLLAYVPEYAEVRTFAAERIQDISLLEERFTPDTDYRDLPETAFPHSLGVHSAPPERVEIDFQPAVADYVRARQWHPSQQVADLPGAAVRVTLDVCIDRALHGWILSFGPSARVVSPESLTREIAKQIEAARTQYIEQSPAP
jgi:predicted DNA-binding transcriptional regulator YafY